MDTEAKVEENRVMGIVHINRKGDSYYLHQGVTKRGNPKYYF